jgi:hypothetical protein
LGFVRAHEEARAIGEQLRVDRLAQEVARAGAERALDQTGPIEPGREYDGRTCARGQVSDRFAQRDAVAVRQLGVDDHERGANARKLCERATAVADVHDLEVRRA